MKKQELDKFVDSELLEEFDALVFSGFCSKPEVPIKSIETTNRYNVGYEPQDVWRRIKVDIEQNVTFAKVVTKGNTYPPVSITIAGSFTHLKGQRWFSFTDFCSIFLPQDRFEVTGDWKKTLNANLRVLRNEVSHLYERDICVSISNENSQEKKPPFWEQIETTLKHQFYASAYPIIKSVVERAVPDITLGARWGSDSPYQRFKEAEKWALISFRYTKRQQIDIVQFVEAKKIRFKCARMDLGFLENGYGKVAKIREMISMEVDINASSEKIQRAQSEFLSRVLKDLPSFMEAGSFSR